MEQRIIDLYNDFDLGLMDRREFMVKLAVIAGSTGAAYSLLTLLGNDYNHAETISKNDPRIRTETMKYPGVTGDIPASLAIPRKREKVPGVIVIHTMMGLNDHIRDIARRLAVEGFMAIAPDLFAPLGGTPEDLDRQQAFSIIGKLNDEDRLKNCIAARKYLQNHSRSNGNVGVVGFCWGGDVSNQMAVNSPDLKAVVTYYGTAPKAEDVPKIKAPLMLHCGGNDDRFNAGIPAFEDALKKASVEYKLYMYEGAEHGFFNDTSEAYHKDAAPLSWTRTIEFLTEKLKNINQRV